MEPVVSAWLTFVAEDPVPASSVTARIGFVPTEAWDVGDVLVTRTGRALPPMRTAGVRLVVGPERTLDLAGVLDRLLAPVEAALPQVRATAEALGLRSEVSLHIKVAGATPVGTIDRGLLERIVALGADFDLDLYVVDEDYEPPAGPGSIAL